MFNCRDAARRVPTLFSWRTHLGASLLLTTHYSLLITKVAKFRIAKYKASINAIQYVRTYPAVSNILPSGVDSVANIAKHLPIFLKNTQKSFVKKTNKYNGTTKKTTTFAHAKGALTDRTSRRVKREFGASPKQYLLL